MTGRKVICVRWGDYVRGIMACASAGPIWTTWWNVVRRYHKQQQDRSEPNDGMLSDVTTNSSRTDLSQMMECCQTLSQTAAGQIWTTWWNVVRRYHKQQQEGSEPLDGISSDVFTNRRSSYVAEYFKTQKPPEASRSPKLPVERTALFIPTKYLVILTLVPSIFYYSVQWTNKYTVNWQTV
jgi:hypothetical protein